MRGLAAPLVVLVTVASAAVPAAAEPPWKGEEWDAKADSTPGGGGQIQAELTVPTGRAAGGGDGGTGSGGAAPASGDTAGRVDKERGMKTQFWRQVDGPCRAPAPGPAPPARDEAFFQLLEHDARTGITTIVETDCRDPAETPDAPAPPPRAPTVGEITDLVRAEVAPPTVGISPDPEGITGMQTRFWYEGPREASVSLGIRGYSITATMRPTQYCWNSGDPAGGQLCSPEPGSEDDWAADWVYETKGRYEITAETVWNGTWTFSGYGASASGELATIRTTATRDYPVGEVRSRLTNRP